MYLDYLKQMLEPLQVYELDRGAGAAELEVIGAQLDEIFVFLETLIGEMLPLTAQGYGLQSYEGLLPYRPACPTVEDRQRAVAALLRIRGGCFTKEQLQGTVSGCGLAASVEEAGGGIAVSFPGCRGIPENIDALKTRILQILPCHLAVSYHYVYTLWSELMAMAGTWAQAQALCGSWRLMEIVEAQE